MEGTTNDPGDGHRRLTIQVFANGLRPVSRTTVNSYGLEVGLWTFHSFVVSSFFVQHYGSEDTRRTCVAVWGRLGTTDTRKRVTHIGRRRSELLPSEGDPGFSR